MALVNLGTNTIAIEDGWVSFDAIELSNNRGYTPEILIDSTNPGFIYSRFVIRYGYPTLNETSTVSVQIAEVFYDPNWQFFPLHIDPNLENRENAILQVRRFSTFQEPSQLADANVTIRIDPNENYRL